MLVSPAYSDQLRQVMLSNGLPVSPIKVREGGEAALRFDSVDVTDTTVAFLWLGKPVMMVRRNEGHPTAIRGETTIALS